MGDNWLIVGLRHSIKVERNEVVSDDMIVFSMRDAIEDDNEVGQIVEIIRVPFNMWQSSGKQINDTIFPIYNRIGQLQKII